MSLNNGIGLITLLSLGLETARETVLNSEFWDKRREKKKKKRKEKALKRYQRWLGKKPKHDDKITPETYTWLKEKLEQGVEWHYPPPIELIKKGTTQV